MVVLVGLYSLAVILLRNTLPDNTLLAKTLTLNNWEKYPERYFKDCLKIIHKEKLEKISFELNSHQKKIQRAIDGQRAEGKPVRILILKPRQTGISTISIANIFHANRFNGGVGMVVSKDGDSASHLHTITQRFYNYLPASEKRIIKTIASNRAELRYEEPHGGRILIETAGKQSAGHSFTLHQLHLSEGARWPAGCDDTRTGLMNAVGYFPNTIIINESVANGMAGWFYDEWHRKDSTYAKVFLPVHEHTEYQMELGK